MNSLALGSIIYRSAGVGNGLYRQSLAISSGASIKAVRRLLGHASAAIAFGMYRGLYDEDLEDLADRVEQLHDTYEEKVRRLSAAAVLSREPVPHRATPDRSATRRKRAPPRSRLELGVQWS